MRRCSTARSDLRAALLKQVRERIEPYGLGVEVLDAPVALIAPPDEVKSAFDDVAREQTRIATKVNNAEQEAESQWRTALSDQYRIEQETAAYTDNRKTLARREAESFLNRLHQYQEGRRDNPDYLRQIWDEERGKLFAEAEGERPARPARRPHRAGRAGPRHAVAAAAEAVSLGYFSHFVGWANP